jgi:STE24 endopeptidase
VAVPDEEDACLGGGERGERSEGREHVLPHGVARARVVEPDVALGALGLERLEIAPGLLVEHRGRPAGARGGVVGEILEVEPTEDAQVVVSYEGDVGPFGDERAAPVRARAVTDEVAQAPDGVGRVNGNGFEHSFQRMQISVNVRDDSDAHRGRATLAKRGAVLAAAAAWIVSGVFLWRTEVPHLQLATLDPRAYFGAQELTHIADFRRLSRALLLGSLLVEASVLAVFVWQAGGLAEALGSLTRGRIRTGAVLGALIVVALWLAVLPLGGVAHWWRRRYGLSGQGYLGWLRDQAVSLGIELVLVVIAVAAFMALASWLGRSWWLAGAPALALAATLFVLAQPLVVQPLFNRFEPLADQALATQIEALARKEGVKVDAVEVADASRQTTAANAYVAGIGPTRRVVLFDTLLDGRFTQPEILSVSAHELAHVGRLHLWKGLGWLALLAVPCVFLLAWLTERRGGLADPVNVPLGVAVAFALLFLTLPFSNAVSRRYEAEADWIALRTTGDPTSFVQVERKLVLSGLVDPDPPGWLSFWTSTHPSAMKRIAMAQAFRAYRLRAGS